MQDWPRLFLSYSSHGDAAARNFIQQLFGRLQQQDIDPWVFESPQGEIQAGGSISLECRRKIEEADVFVVFIDDAALISDYVDMEVSHALWESTRRSLPVVPLVHTLKLRHTWRKAMAEAIGFKGLHLPSNPVDDLESVIVHLCAVAKVEYQPPAAHAPRFPLRQRLSQELQSMHTSSTYRAGDFISVMRKADLAVAAMEVADYAKARRLLDALLTEIELQYGSPRTYYPRIAYGVVLMAEAQAERCSFMEVERYFATLIEEAGDQLDANAHAGRAHALMALQRYAEALAAYDAAEPYLESPDAALFYNMVRARVLGRLGMDRAEIERRRAALTEGLATRVPGDLARLTSSVALAYAYIGDVDSALAAWHAVVDLDAVFPELVVDIADTLHKLDEQRSGRQGAQAAHFVISDYLGRRSDLPDTAILQLGQLRARIAFDLGDRSGARRLLANLIEQHPRAPILKVDAAMFALGDGDPSAARRLCENVVGMRDHTECAPSLTAPEFNFALGQAFWLLGRRPEARESFRRSGYPASMRYEILIPGEAGQAR